MLRKEDSENMRFKTVTCTDLYFSSFLFYPLNVRLEGVDEYTSFCEK